MKIYCRDCGWGITYSGPCPIGCSNCGSSRIEPYDTPEKPAKDPVAIEGDNVGK